MQWQIMLWGSDSYNLNRTWMILKSKSQSDTPATKFLSLWWHEFFFRILGAKYSLRWINSFSLVNTNGELFIPHSCGYISGLLLLISDRKLNCSSIIYHSTDLQWFLAWNNESIAFSLFPENEIKVNKLKLEPFIY